jgi:hypothetical protein
MGEKMFTIKSELVRWPSVVSDDLVQSVDQIIVKDHASQYQNFRVNFHKFHAFSSTGFSELG